MAPRVEFREKSSKGRVMPAAHHQISPHLISVLTETPESGLPRITPSMLPGRYSKWIVKNRKSLEPEAPIAVDSPVDHVEVVAITICNGYSDIRTPFWMLTIRTPT